MQNNEICFFNPTALARELISHKQFFFFFFFNPITTDHLQNGCLTREGQNLRGKQTQSAPCTPFHLPHLHTALPPHLPCHHHHHHHHPTPTIHSPAICILNDLVQTAVMYHQVELIKAPSATAAGQLALIN